MSTAKIAPRSSSKALVSLSVVVALLASAVPARADDTDESDARIRRGLQLRREQKDVEALAEFQRAYALAPTPRGRAQIAFAEQSLGQWIAAEADLHAALAAEDPWIAQHREALVQALGFVEQHLAWMRVDTNVQGAEVSLNGVVVGTTPMATAARVVVGTVLVRLSAQGYVAAERAMAIGANEQVHAFVEMSAADAPASASSAPVIQVSPRSAFIPGSVPGSDSVRSGASSRPVFWGGVGLTALGVAGLGIGTYFGVNVLVAKGKRDQHCTPNACDAAGEAYDSSARRDSVASTIALATAVPLLAGGVVMLVLGTKEGAPRVAVVPEIGRGASSLRVEGTW